MDRLISVPAARSHIEAAVGDPILKASINAVLDGLPAVDTVPVVHGRWEWRHVNEYTEILTCSVCSKTEGADERHKYCPNCAAKMDLEVPDG